MGPGGKRLKDPLKWTQEMEWVDDDTWMSRWKLGSMGYNLLINGAFWGYN